MHKKTAPLFVHYGEPEKIKKSFAFNVDIFNIPGNYKEGLHFLLESSMIIHVNKIRKKFFGAGCNSLPAV